MQTLEDVRMGFINVRSRRSTTEFSNPLMPGPQAPALLLTHGTESPSETQARLGLLLTFPPECRRDAHVLPAWRKLRITDIHQEWARCAD